MAVIVSSPSSCHFVEFFGRPRIQWLGTSLPGLQVPSASAVFSHGFPP